MGKLIVEQIISADGFAADEQGGLDFFVGDDDLTIDNTDQLEMLETVDAIVFGATTFRMFQQYWPARDPAVEGVAGPINTLPKHVISSTVDDPSWGDHAPATIERGEAVPTVRELKQRYSGNIMVWGSLTLTEALFAAGLVDTVRLRIVPVLLGSGRPSARGADTPLKLVSANVFEAGTNGYPAGQLTLEFDVVQPAQ